LEEIRCPTYVIGADGDYFPTEEKEIYVQLIPGAELRVIEEARHALPAEKPGEFNAVVQEFLSGQNERWFQLKSFRNYFFQRITKSIEERRILIMSRLGDLVVLGKMAWKIGKWWFLARDTLSCKASSAEFYHFRICCWQEYFFVLLYRDRTSNLC